jgi:biopolymer transport protein ExbD
MNITFSCPYCGKKLAASETSVGKQKTCPNCRGRVTVPTADAAARAAAAGEIKPRTVDDHPLLFMPRRVNHKDLIDMTAMVDIVFFLLIFFLVTSMQSIEAVIGLPKPEAASAAPDSVQAVPDITQDPNFVVVTIDADDAHNEGKDGLMISGAGDSTHGKFVMVLDAGAEAGMTEIMFSVPQADDAGAGG